MRVQLVVKTMTGLAVLCLGLPACEDQCGADVPPYLDVEGAAVQALRAPAGRPPQVLTAGDVLPSTELQLAFRLQARYYAASPERGGCAAYACSPADPGYRGSDERVDSLTVRSRFRYDATHPAGSSLNDLIGAAGLPLQSTVEAHRIAGPEGRPLPELLLRLRQAPAASGPQQFVIRYRQTNGEVYTSETPVIQVQR